MKTVYSPSPRKSRRIRRFCSCNNSESAIFRLCAECLLSLPCSHPRSPCRPPPLPIPPLAEDVSLLGSGMLWIGEDSVLDARRNLCWLNDLEEESTDGLFLSSLAPGVAKKTQQTRPLLKTLMTASAGSSSLSSVLASPVSKRQFRTFSPSPFRGMRSDDRRKRETKT